jgi:hypothetical protein
MIHPRSSRARFVAALSLMALAAGCAARAPRPAGAPVDDPEALVARFHSATAPGSPRQASFNWTLEEAGSRVTGRGVVRFVAPDRLRLDLFGPRGETYLAAALVGDEFRVPPAATQGVALPSPALLWAALGIFRAPPGGSLSTATAGEGEAALLYRAGEEGFDFSAREVGDDLRLVAVERIGPSGVLETVRLDYEPDGDLRRTRYRDWSAFRDLTFELESIKDVESFPEAIWSPGRDR